MLVRMMVFSIALMLILMVFYFIVKHFEAKKEEKLHFLHDLEVKEGLKGEKEPPKKAAPKPKTTTKSSKPKQQ